MMLGPFAISDVVVKFKAYEFRFRREPTDYVPEQDLCLWFGLRRMIPMRAVMGLGLGVMMHGHLGAES
jgi:hypothetical protein